MTTDTSSHRASSTLPTLPRVSVVATVRNERSTIEGFVDSLLAQSRAPDEIIIVDGESTDGTLELLREYGRKHSVRVISQPCNIAMGRNLGIAAATGTHIAVTDAGCKIDPDWLRHLIACFLAQPSADVVAGNFRFETRTPFEETVVLATFRPDRDKSDDARFYPSSRSVAFTKLAWQRAGGYPEWLYAAEDTLFNIRLRQVGCEFVFCQQAFVWWRPRENWRALAKQRINFARGNARVGIGTPGYLVNLRIHAAAAALIAAAPLYPLLLLIAFMVLGRHVWRNLWPQAIRATVDRPRSLTLKTIMVMEFVRIVSLYGFLLGRMDRLRDPQFIARQRNYMGVASIDELATAGTS